MSFLGIRITPDVGRLLQNLQVPGDLETPSEYHITLLCFDDDWAISKIAQALEATYDIVSQINPFQVTGKKISHFSPMEKDKPVPIIIPIESKELMGLHKKLAKKFDDQGLEFKKTFKEYKPHITLAYSKDGFDDFKIDPTIEFTVNELVLWGGDNGDERVFITFPLKGPERKKKSDLFSKIDNLNKLAAHMSVLENFNKLANHMTIEKALKLLNLTKDYSDNDLKHAMKSLIFQHHPDRKGDPEKLKEVILAYKLLRDDNSSNKIVQEKSKIEEPSWIDRGHPWGDWYNK